MYMGLLYSCKLLVQYVCGRFRWTKATELGNVGLAADCLAHQQQRSS
jgi:hypothetical protein